MRSIKYALKSIQEDSDIPQLNGLQQALLLKKQQDIVSAPLPLTQSQKLSQDLGSENLPKPVIRQPVIPLTQNQKLNQDLGSSPKKSASINPVDEAGRLYC